VILLEHVCLHPGRRVYMGAALSRTSNSTWLGGVHRLEHPLGQLSWRVLVGVIVDPLKVFDESFLVFMMDPNVSHDLLGVWRKPSTHELGLVGELSISR
jgi:hypothetical protein